MSGDTQTKKRKDKKRKKDDEDTVKETTVHAPKQPSAGAAQAAKEPGDVQMHIHSDHGTGGHWCARVVFFFLLGALGALIGLIIVENQGLSNDDTPLSESRYSEFFSGWVDETRQDDHHHEEILAAINSLDDHDDSLDDHVEDHEAHEAEGEQDDQDDGAPYPEEEDNDDEEEAVQDDDEDEAQAQKLDDDEVEEIYAQQEAAQHEANVNPEGDDGDDGDDDDGDDDDGDDDDGANDKTNVDDDVKQNDKAGDDDDNDENDDDDDKNDNDADEDNEPDHDKTKTVAETVDNEEENDDDEDDKDEQIVVKEDDDGKSEATTVKMGSNAELDDDDDDDGNTFKGIDDTPFEEINLSNAMNDTAKQSLHTPEGTVNAAPACLQEADSSKGEFCALPKQTEPNQATSPKSVSEHVTRDDLTDQMDELVRNYNKLAASLDVPQVEQTSSAPETDDDDEDFDGDEEEIEEETNKVGDDEDENDDDEAAFDAFVDNDGGEEEYLAKVRREQEQRLAAEEERKSAVEPEEETSQKSPGNVDDSKAKLENPTNIAQTAQTPSLQQPVQRTETATKSVLDDFVYSDNPVQLSPDGTEVIEGNVFILEDEVDERYSGDEYEYELEELDEMEEEIEELPPADDEEERNLIKQEQEIGAFVPITFEDFSSMYRPSPEVAGSMLVDTQEQQVLEQQQQQPQQHVKKSSKESLLTRKKPPKGAFNKLIYGLHKDPIVIPAEEGDEEHTGGLAAIEARENVSAKGEARSVLTALLSEIPSPPPTELDHQFDKLVSPVLPRTTPQSDRSLFQRHSPVLGATGESTVALPSMAREKHVEFLLPDRETEPEFELQSGAPVHPPADNGSKENLFVPDASEEEELEPDEYGEEYDEYEDQEVEEEHVYDEDDIDSVLLNQYGSDEEEEPLTDDNIQPGGGDGDDGSDVDDSDLMRRLEEKYGKLPAGAAPAPDASAKAVPSAAGLEEPDDDEAVAAGWTKIPTRAEEAERSYQEELRRAQQQLDEGQAQEALSTFERVLSRKAHSIPALVGRGRALDALAEQRRSNAILNDAIVAYRKVIAQELAVDDATLASVAERCIDRLRFQGQHAKAIDVHQTLIRRFDDEPRYRNQLAVTYLYLNRLPEAKAVLHETLLRWIEDGFALVHYGFVLKTHDQNMELAAQYLREGIDTGHEGTQDGRFYFHLGDALQRLGRIGEAHDTYRRGVERKLFLSLYQRSLYNVDGLRSRPFWTEEQTTFAAELERIRSQWLLIRDEGMKLLTGAGVFVNETENLRDRGDWRQLELFARGARVERNCALAPLTCRLVEQHFPAARTCKRGQVKFSVMHPGTHVWPHCGPTNCRIRAHLGLNVPAGTYIRVAKQTRSWENGKWLIFDDSFEHEVWHNGTTARLVLIVDFWHPDLTESQRRSLSPI